MRPYTLGIAALALTGLSLTALALPAAAQVAPYPYGAPNYGPNAVTTGDVHRYEMDRLRAGAQANDALARSQSLNTRLTLQELQARRASTPVEPYRPLPLRSPEQERAAREAATARRETTARGVGQIDAWLDRVPRQNPQ